MGDGQHGAPLREPVDGLDDLGLGVEVDLAGGLIEDEQGAVGEEGTGQGDALRLAAGQPQPLLPQEGAQPLGHAADLVVEIGGLQGAPQAGIVGIGVGQAEVVGDGAGEQPGRLGDDGAGGADGVLRARGRGGADHAHGACGGEQVAAGQRDERGLARPGGPDDGDVLAGLHSEVDAGQDGLGSAGRPSSAMGRPGRPVRTAMSRPGRRVCNRSAPPGARPGGRHPSQGQRGPAAVGALGHHRQPVVWSGAAGTLDGQQAAHGPLVGHAPHTHVEEGAHVVQGLEEHIAHQGDGEGVAHCDGARGQASQGHADGGGDEEQGEQAVGDEDDELVAGQQPHDCAAVVLARAAQVGGAAAGGPGEGEGGQPLDGVEVLGGEPEALGARFRRRSADLGVKSDDGAGHEDDGDHEHGGGHPVDRGGEQHQDERRGQAGGDGGGQEGLAVQRDALRAVGQQGHARPGAGLRSASRAEGEDVAEQAGANRALLLGGAGAGDRLDHELARAGEDGGCGCHREVRAPGPVLNAGQEIAEAASEADERPALGESGGQGEDEGEDVGAPPGGGADGDARLRRPAAPCRGVVTVPGRGVSGLRRHGTSWMVSRGNS